MLRAVQQVLLDALLSDDPAERLRQQVKESAELSDQERAWLQGLDADGLILTSLIVKKLRFERLTRADRRTADLFDTDPGRFLELFQAYTSAVPPGAYFPGQEAELFRRWSESV